MSRIDPAVAKRRTRDRRFRKYDGLTGLVTLGFIVAVVGFVVFLVRMFAVTWDARNGTGNCGMDAPPPAGATPETYYIRVGYLPLGIDCVWMVGDGQEVVERSTDWTSSLVTYGTLLVAVAGTVVGVKATGARSRLPRVTGAPTVDEADPDQTVPGRTEG